MVRCLGVPVAAAAATATAAAAANMMQEGPVRDKSDDEAEKEERPLYFAKIVVVGDCGVGKTSLMRAFFDADFSQSYMATVGVDFRIATIPMDDIDVKVHVWDTAGQERYRSLTAAYFRGATGIAICYDASLASYGSGEEHHEKQQQQQLFATRKSKVFRGVERWKELVDHSVDEKAEVLLVGTKLDMCFAYEGLEEDAIGESFSEELGIPHVLTSSRDNINVKAPFLHIIRSLREKGLLRPSNKSGERAAAAAAAAGQGLACPDGHVTLDMSPPPPGGGNGQAPLLGGEGQAKRPGLSCACKAC
ncbi:MAG: hypothetical protein CMI26_08335 [Opitutae bacterium]|nr:hypothetical protein [Opitutae bacterium]